MTLLKFFSPEMASSVQRIVKQRGGLTTNDDSKNVYNNDN